MIATVVVVAVALQLLDGVPETIRRLVAGKTPVPYALSERLEYPSIEAAEKELGVQIMLPSYFPSYLAWPPAAVRGQAEPVKVVSMLFHSEDGQQGLQIREVYWPDAELPFPIPGPLDLLERRGVDLNGVPGQLLLGRGQSNSQVNQLRWRYGGVHIVVTTIYPVEELLRIARSMHE